MSNTFTETWLWNMASSSLSKPLFQQLHERHQQFKTLLRGQVSVADSQLSLKVAHSYLCYFNGTHTKSFMSVKAAGSCSFSMNAPSEWRLVPRQQRKRDYSDQSVDLKLSRAHLHANEQRRRRISSQLQIRTWFPMASKVPCKHQFLLFLLRSPVSWSCWCVTVHLHDIQIKPKKRLKQGAKNILDIWWVNRLLRSVDPYKPKPAMWHLRIKKYWYCFLQWI